MVHNGLTNSDKDFEMCARVENVVLPQRGYFGLSAATGGLADDHDVGVVYFVVHYCILLFSITLHVPILLFSINLRGDWLIITM